MCVPRRRRDRRLSERRDSLCSEIHALFDELAALSGALADWDGVEPSGAELEARFAAMEAQYGEAGDDIPRPPHWGGYRLAPSMLEFWQGRPSRLHDRIRYRRDPHSPDRWVIERLAP